MNASETVIRTSVLVAAILGVTAARGADRPSWADRQLPEVPGMVLWLDAAAQPRAWRARNIDSVASGDPLEWWFDSSGNERHFRQTDAARRPLIRLEDKAAAVRFNGRAACLALSDTGITLNEATFVIVAAPYNNEGTFRGLFSGHAPRKFDYLSGVNIDQGAFTSSRFDVVNVEGAGAAGMENLRTSANPFLEFRRLAVTSAVGPKGIVLYVDGQREGARGRNESVINMDEMLLAARYYGGVEEPRSFFAGEIAEVLIYDHVLSDKDRHAIDRYLAHKYAEIGPAPMPEELEPPRAIKRVPSPPVVQMHVPGFDVRELPLKMSNINNVLYREDGALVALAYDGKVFLLRDADGDGLEDEASLFWDSGGELRAPIGMALTPPGYARGRGVVVAAKGKCVIIVDVDGDDVADKEFVAAEGWQELWHGVDALGAAFDPKDHSIYFGLGVQNFTDAYLVGKGDEAKYRLDGERGTILRIAPDLKSREIFATGIRFPVAIRFNAEGDLFCTDQEGATWLANGNPFDELLHVQKDRHYGFPPRHPRHLPKVIDEPSAFDYRPQHQSTCGLNFNEPGVDETTFGPSWWRSDALVSGYSRGKLYRTKLHRTPAGYVGQNQLFATLSMLAVDACVAPRGALLVAAHSGPPDWGTGPTGAGKLFKIVPRQAPAPLPSVVWAEGPQEVRIAFDRALNIDQLHQIASRMKIEGGEFVVAGDRFETLRPPYALVEHQLSAPRFGVEVHGVQLTPDHRTLVVTTAPHASAMTYAIAITGHEPSAVPAKGAIEQLPDLDLQFDLCGLKVEWQPEAGAAWQGWLPHPDLRAAQQFTKASATHDALWQAMEHAGVLTMAASLNLRDMLRPAVQTGSTIDYEWPPENVTLTFSSDGPFEVTLDATVHQAKQDANGRWLASIATPPQAEGDRRLVLSLQHAGGPPPEFTVHYHTNEDSRPRALALNRFLLPWAERSTEPPPVVDNRNLPELKGGNWLRGQKEFFGATAGCSKCHQVRGQGHAIGPDLSNLTKRDYASVLRDISQPSYAINPDHVTSLVVTIDGLALTGAVRTVGENVIVADQEGKETVVPKEDVESLQPLEMSIMPEGLPKALGPDRLRDLLTFLLVEPPRMPVYGELKPPQPRKVEEVEAAIAGSQLEASAKPLRIVLVTGPKDHGPGEHDYPAWQVAWQQLLSLDESLRVTTAAPWPSEEDLKTADVLVFYQQGAWTPERAADIDRFFRRGGGCVYIHYAVDGGGDPAGFAERIGLAWQGLRSKFRHGPLEVQFKPDQGSHPISRNFNKVHFHDESYWNLVGDAERIKLLATGIEEDKPQPLFWTHEPEMGGRVFVSIPGHFSWTFDDPLFRLLLLRGIAWSAGESVDRLNELALPGARVTFPDQPQ